MRDHHENRLPSMKLKTIFLFLNQGPMPATTVKTIDDAVMMATVEGTWAVFKINVSKKGKKIPIVCRLIVSLNCSPILAAARHSTQRLLLLR